MTQASSQWCLSVDTFLRRAHSGKGREGGLREPFGLPRTHRHTYRREWTSLLVNVFQGFTLAMVASILEEEEEEEEEEDERL